MSEDADEPASNEVTREKDDWLNAVDDTVKRCVSEALDELRETIENAKEGDCIPLGDDLHERIVRGVIAELENGGIFSVNTDGIKFLTTDATSVFVMEASVSWDDALLLNDHEERYPRGSYAALADHFEKLAVRLRQFEQEHGHELDEW